MYLHWSVHGYYHWDFPHFIGVHVPWNKVWGKNDNTMTRIAVTKNAYTAKSGTQTAKELVSLYDKFINCPLGSNILYCVFGPMFSSPLQHSFDIWDWRKGAINAIKGLDPWGICSVCISLIIRSLQVLWQNLENMYWDGKEGPCSSPLEEKESLANVLRFLLSRRIISTSTAASLQGGIREIATMDLRCKVSFWWKMGIPIENGLSVQNWGPSKSDELCCPYLEVKG